MIGILKRNCASSCPVFQYSSLNTSVLLFMPIRIQPVRTDAEFDTFLRFPWKVNHGDPNWVAPLLDSRRERLDPARNPFWKSAERETWLALDRQEVLGTLAAFWPKGNSPGGIGYFGFFESVNDLAVSSCLLGKAADWLHTHGAGSMRGPFNPAANDEPGILVEGFMTRPAVTQAHNPSYYPALLEAGGFQYQNDLVARLVKINPEIRSVDQILPARLNEVAVRAAQRKDLVVRKIELRRWDEEIGLACDLYNRALAPIPDMVPIPLEEFLALAESFRPILDPDLALIAEIGSHPVGYVLALPDINEAFQPLDGRLNALNMIRLWWVSKRLKRVCFKILVILPEYQGRGVEAILIRELSRNILKHHFHEVDMSLTGDDNQQSSRFQEHLGFQVYRRYRVYQKDLK
jgi:GNAT superfamily N-acetyltransferase